MATWSSVQLGCAVVCVGPDAGPACPAQLYFAFPSALESAASLLSTFPKEKFRGLRQQHTGHVWCLPSTSLLSFFFFLLLLLLLPHHRDTG